ncbi:hypothetical protein BGZ94_001721 [Podila epigama]|nr:hypothetical protein BGZ94_001721 [Podila epigama]
MHALFSLPAPSSYHNQQLQHPPAHFEPGYRLGRASAPSLLSAATATATSQDQPHSERPSSPAGTGTALESSGATTLNNKRRSLADLLFVPIKSKDKRNSSSASSVSSIDSTNRHEEGGDHPPWPTQSNFGPKKNTEQRSPPPPPTGSGRRQSTKGGKGQGAGGHTGSSPKTFQCTGYPGCNMVFTRSEHLARHERKHTGEKPYRCIVANCPRVFSRYDNMIQHTQTHSDRSKRDSLVSGTSGAASRSSSLQSTTPQHLSALARGGKSPVVFGAGHEDHRAPQHGSNIAGQPSQGQHYPQPHPYATSQSGMQWSLPSGAPSGTSSPMVGRGSINYFPGRDVPGDSPHQQPQQLHHPDTPTYRTLKANSRSLPHLQPRDSPAASAGESPSLALQQKMSSMEIEEIKRQKSEVLLPSSSSAVSGARMSMPHIRGPGQAPGPGPGPGIGLGVSPFVPTTNHTQMLPHVETLSPQEQMRLNEHRRSAQAMMLKMNASTGSIDSRSQSEQQQHPDFHAGGRGVGSGKPNLSSSQGPPPFTHFKHLSPQERDRLMEHRKSTPELTMHEYSARRSSHEDMTVQLLPSRDSRSGMTWFSQVAASPSMASSRFSKEDGAETATVLPPLLGHYGPSTQKEPSMYGKHSSNVHPLSRHGSLTSPHDARAPIALRTIDAYLPPAKEQQCQQMYAPIQKNQVVDAIERMDHAQFQDLKTKVSITFANDQSRAPLFLGNIIAMLCTVGTSPTDVKQESRRSSGGLGAPSSPRPSQQAQDTMDVDEDPKLNKEPKVLMEVDGDGTPINDPSNKARIESTPESASSIIPALNVTSSSSSSSPPPVTPMASSSPPLDHVTCRFALDINADAFKRDPVPVLRSLDELTVSCHRAIPSFVAGLESVLNGNEPGWELGREDFADGAREKSSAHIGSRRGSNSVQRSKGFPSKVRLGRFFMRENSFPVPGAIILVQSLSPDDLWRTCEFKEYPGVSIWVPEKVYARYLELAADPSNKMSLTLVRPLDEGPQQVPVSSKTEKMEDHEASFARRDSNVSQPCAETTLPGNSGNDVAAAAKGLEAVSVPESVLSQEILVEVWADMHWQYMQHQHQFQLQQQQEQQQQQQLHQHQQQHYQQPPPQQQQHPEHQQGQHQYFQSPSNTVGRVATFEEHQRDMQWKQQQRRGSAPVFAGSTSFPSHVQQVQDQYHPHPHPAHYPQRHHPYPPRASFDSAYFSYPRLDSHEQNSRYPPAPLLTGERRASDTNSADMDHDMNEEWRQRVLDRRGNFEQGRREQGRQYRDIEEAEQDGIRQADKEESGATATVKRTGDYADDEYNEEHGEHGAHLPSTASSSPSSSSSSTRPRLPQPSSASHPPRDANMLRRISIAELCNPMKSLATERP